MGALVAQEPMGWEEQPEAPQVSEVVLVSEDSEEAVMQKKWWAEVEEIKFRSLFFF